MTASTTTTLLDPVQMIHLRRHGFGGREGQDEDNIKNEHSDEALRWWIEEFTAGRIPDYQMAAWLMATCLRPLSARETATLTRCMVQSTPGGPLQWDKFIMAENNKNNSNRENITLDGGCRCRCRLVDKHSTGGVGDKVSLILAPLVAACSETVAVPMIAGRGLGHTGGTIDKLESIPGFNCQMMMMKSKSSSDDSDNDDNNNFQLATLKVGCCIAAAGPQLCPADQKLYALRDVTATVESIPLQTASIMCKKIAEHPHSLVLDVKYGSGAFQSTPNEAAELAKSMVFTGESNGLKPTTAFLTQMNQPLGYAIGNWYEVQECLEILHGESSWKKHSLEQSSSDLLALVCIQAGQMLWQAHINDPDDDDGTLGSKSCRDWMQVAYDTLKQGKALGKFKEMALQQGADRKLAETCWYPSPDGEKGLYLAVLVRAPTSGHITAIQTMKLGWTAVALGAGRKMAHDVIDPYSGMMIRKKLGSVVKIGDVLLELYAPPDKITEAIHQQALACFTIDDNYHVSSSLLKPTPVVTHIVTVEDGVQELPWDAFPEAIQKWMYP